MEINVTVEYSTKAQKIMVANGKNAASRQVLKLMDESCQLLPYATIDSDGKISLMLRDIIKDWYVKKDAIFNDPNYPTFHIDGEDNGNGWIYNYKFTVSDYRPIYPDLPITSIEDILALIATNQETKKTLELTLPALAAQSTANYQRFHQLFITQEHEKETRKQIKAELETEYQNAQSKIAQIAELIEGKQRIRTAQITTIIN